MATPLLKLADNMLRKFRTRELGQNFLVNRAIAESESEHAHGKVVLEIGPGKGILTAELCKRATKVIAVEKDTFLYSQLKRELQLPNLVLINADFLKLDLTEADIDEIDIVIANIPYGISGKVIEWLSENKKEAVLCLQKEFVMRMLAKPGEAEYSKLSVFSHLSLKTTEIMPVPRGNFSPSPNVDSEIIYARPTGIEIPKGERDVIGLLMQHKKKTLRNAVIDSRKFLGLGKEDASELAESLDNKKERVFSMSPTEILDATGKILDSIQKTKGS